MTCQIPDIRWIKSSFLLDFQSEFIVHRIIEHFKIRPISFIQLLLLIWCYELEIILQFSTRRPLVLPRKVEVLLCQVCVHQKISPLHTETLVPEDVCEVHLAQSAADGDWQPVLVIFVDIGVEQIVNKLGKCWLCISWLPNSSWQPFNKSVNFRHEIWWELTW